LQSRTSDDQLEFFRGSQQGIAKIDFHEKTHSGSFSIAADKKAGFLLLQRFSSL
jgi:hypothetical protein